jgi:hypothetical protein
LPSPSVDWMAATGVADFVEDGGFSSDFFL